MVKHTVRFPKVVVDEISSTVEDGVFESKSEFHRFATDYVLHQTVDGYEPETIDYEQIKEEVLPQSDDDDQFNEELPFFESVVIVRKYALRGEVSDAEDFLDHHYGPGHPHAMILEELLNAYRTRTEGKDPTPSPKTAPPDQMN